MWANSFARIPFKHCAAVLELRPRKYVTTYTTLAARSEPRYDTTEAPSNNVGTNF